MSKIVIPRTQALRDVEQAADYYTDEGGADLGLRFASALADTYAAIGRHPASGSPRYGHALNMPELRSRKLSRFPYLVLYFDRVDHVDVWRVLHAKQDIPAWLDD